MQTIIVGTPGPQGSKGDPGEPREKRSDFNSGFSYCGYAELNSLEIDPVWTITRIIVFQDGTVTTGIANNVNWTDRYTHTYS